MSQITANKLGVGMMYRITTVACCNLKASGVAACQPNAAQHGVLPKLRDRRESGTKIARGSFGVRERILDVCMDSHNTKSYS